MGACIDNFVFPGGTGDVLFGVRGRKDSGMYCDRQEDYDMIRFI
jgi:hypothetical protein